MLPVPEEKIVRKWRLQPGKMLLIDLEEGRIIDDDEIKQNARRRAPLRGLAERDAVEARGAARAARGRRSRRVPNDPSTRLDLQQAFGYTQEDIQFFLEPMAQDGDDPVGSMGTDTPIAALSNRPKLLYNYFKQNFAQVTNPPIDPIREELVMSLISMIGPRLPAARARRPPPGGAHAVAGSCVVGRGRFAGLQEFLLLLCKLLLAPGDLGEAFLHLALGLLDARTALLEL